MRKELTQEGKEAAKKLMDVIDKEIAQEKTEEKNIPIPECPLIVDDAITHIRYVGLNLTNLLTLLNEASLDNEGNSIREIAELILAKDIKRLNRELSNIAGAYGLEYEPLEEYVADTVLGRD